MVKPPVPERQLPFGVADLYFEQAATKSRIERLLKQTFDRWSYSEIMPPTFEYYEPLIAEASPQVREEIYRFFDRDGRTLALRADPTIPIARIVSTKLNDRVPPLRFYYVTSVFRYEEPKAALRREFTQAGVELIGPDTPAADAEVIALAVTALRSIGLGDIRMRIGSMGLVGSLLDELDLPRSQIQAIENSLERKNSAALSELLNGFQIRPELRQALAALPQMTGPGDILMRADCHCTPNERSRTAIQYLIAVHGYLAAMGCSDAIIYDLAMIRGMAYYTGIVFEGFAPGIGFSILSGGRYDKLLSHFGRDLPALGFAIGIERTLAALEPRSTLPVDLAPSVVVEMTPRAEILNRVQHSREHGTRVELSVFNYTRPDLLAFARLRGAREVWFADGEIEVLE